MCDQIGHFDFRNLPESNHTPIRNPRFCGVFEHFRLRTAQVRFRNLPEPTASGLAFDSAFRKNPEITNAKTPVKTALSIPIPEESGNATAAAMADTKRATALHTPTQPKQRALPSRALTPTTTIISTTPTTMMTANTTATTMTMLNTIMMMTTTTNTTTAT